MASSIASITSDAALTTNGPGSAVISTTESDDKSFDEIEEELKKLAMSADESKPISDDNLPKLGENIYGCSPGTSFNHTVTKCLIEFVRNHLKADSTIIMVDFKDKILKLAFETVDKKKIYVNLMLLVDDSRDSDTLPQISDDTFGSDGKALDNKSIILLLDFVVAHVKSGATIWSKALEPDNILKIIVTKSDRTQLYIHLPLRISE